MLTNSLPSSLSGSSIWEQCLDSIEEKVGSSSFETWFRSTELAYTEGGKPYVQVPNQFFADFIEEHFSNLVTEALRAHGIRVEKIPFVPTEKEWNTFEPVIETVTAVREKILPSKVERPDQFHPNYVFDKFVVGDSNRMAHAAGLAVAEAPGKTTFNPLTIYGGTGLGKTHLLQAIGHFAQTEGTAENVVYLTTQEFTNQYINYVIEKRDSTSFYKRFMDVDLLLIDDVHFLSGKPGTQKEFFRIFNNLLMRNKQIVLSSDRAPENIPDMMDHIINRFMGGLTTDIQPPNLETRMAIIRKKAELDGLMLPNDVVQYVAKHITSNVRELEGTLIKLIASSSFTGREITLEVAREIFGDVMSRRDQRVTVRHIKSRTADYFGISANQLSAHTRKRDVAYPRGIAMFLCKKLTKESLRTIGLEFGGRDYSTVIHACKKVESDIQNGRETADHIAQIESLLEELL